MPSELCSKQLCYRNNTLLKPNIWKQITCTMFNSGLTEIKSKFPLASVRPGYAAPPPGWGWAWRWAWQSLSPGPQGQPSYDGSSKLLWGLQLAMQDWKHKEVRATLEIMLMPTYNFHWDTWKRVTLCNTRAREIKKGTNLLAYFFSYGIKYGQFKLLILSAQYRAGKPFFVPVNFLWLSFNSFFF